MKKGPSACLCVLPTGAHPGFDTLVCLCVQEEQVEHPLHAWGSGSHVEPCSQEPCGKLAVVGMCEAAAACWCGCKALKICGRPLVRKYEV